jgi:hypothetical protein
MIVGATLPIAPEEKHGAALHTICAVQPLDGAQQIDGSQGVSAPKNGARALQRAQKAQTVIRNCEVSGDFS